MTIKKKKNYNTYKNKNIAERILIIFFVNFFSNLN